MGLLDRLSRKSAPVVPVELPPEALRDAAACHQSRRDVGHVTRGRGSAVLLSVAGTVHRPEGLAAIVAGRGGPAAVKGENLPAVLRRDPANAHDPNAIRVLVDGVHIGFVPAREAGRFQPLLVECERRGVLLVGSVRPTGGDGGPWGAGLQVRPNLDGWDSAPVKKAAKKTAAAPPPVVLLEGDDLARVVDVLRRLSHQEPVRTKQKAGLVAKQVRELLPALEGHAAALEAVDEKRGQAFGDDVDDLEGVVDDLLDAEDADDREDVHMNLQSEIEDVLAGLETRP